MKAEDREQRLDEVLAAYLEARAHRWQPDRQRLLQAYPDLADELAAFFADEDLVDGVVVPLRSEGCTPPSGALTLLEIQQEPGEAPPGWPRLQGYQILEEVGRGGMGIVYRARHLALNRTVALKMILRGAHAADASLDRFRAEAEASARLNHPHIVQVYEVGECDGLPYLALEFCNGGSLDAQLDGTPLPALDAARLVETLARAVQAAHEKGLVHRDLKPANILLVQHEDRGSKVEDPGEAPPDRRSSVLAPRSAGPSILFPKIADFGLVKHMDAASRTASPRPKPPGTKQNWPWPGITSSQRDHLSGTGNTATCTRSSPAINAPSAVIPVRFGVWRLAPTGNGWRAAVMTTP
jgi:serine/threonine protein kinase